MTGALIGRGGDCDVFEDGSGRVLRRNRDGTSTEVEALTMRHVAAHGYPCPEVDDAQGPDIVMQRLGRRFFVWRFLAATDRDAAVAQLHAALDLRLRDTNLSTAERSTMQSLGDRVT